MYITNNINDMNEDYNTSSSAAANHLDLKNINTSKLTGFF